MNRMQAMIADRLEPRRARALQRVDAIIEAASKIGLDITLVGSLARSDFRIHSDIDLLVRGELSSDQRLEAERLVAEHLRGADLPYDLLFETDLTEERIRELLADALQTP
ncbi:MAG: nucleotidyltransferase domain-containing protein [Rhizobium sp.]|nr:nucleotidyltransferase domain-containing protein [Rhizobium sp.]